MTALLLILLIIIIQLYFRYKPSLEYVEKSKVLILYYNVLNSRDYVIIFRF